MKFGLALMCLLLLPLLAIAADECSLCRNDHRTICESECEDLYNDPGPACLAKCIKSKCQTSCPSDPKAKAQAASELAAPIETEASSSLSSERADPRTDSSTLPDKKVAERK
ncbi:MAG: hypothetical protein KDD42_02100 [Bdellovibrionales bacterium]|nr:hypothetical protein [Bdellovibrionales bacterium]